MKEQKGEGGDLEMVARADEFTTRYVLNDAGELVEEPFGVRRTEEEARRLKNFAKRG